MKPPAPLEALPTGKQVFRAWLPWVILCVVLAFWATRLSGSIWASSLFAPIYHVPGLDKMIMAVPPVVRQADAAGGRLQLSRS